MQPITKNRTHLKKKTESKKNKKQKTNNKPRNDKQNPIFKDVSKSITYIENLHKDINKIRNNNKMSSKDKYKRLKKKLNAKKLTTLRLIEQLIFPLPKTCPTDLIEPYSA